MRHCDGYGSGSHSAVIMMVFVKKLEILKARKLTSKFAQCMVLIYWHCRNDDAGTDLQGTPMWIQARRPL